MKQGGDTEVNDINKTMVTMQPEKSSHGGLLFVPGKDRVEFKPPQRKSLLGLDVLANAKREGSDKNLEFKVPKERIITSFAASIDEGELDSSTGLDEVGVSGGSASNGGLSNYVNRRYRETSARDVSHEDGESTLTWEESINNRYENRLSKENKTSHVS